MENLRFLFLGAVGLALWIGIAGCDTATSVSGTDPYSDLTCSAKLEKMTRELQAFETSKKPAAKTSALDSPATDTTRAPIQVFRAYPPVPLSPVVDTVIGIPNQVFWIPPVGFSDTSKIPPVTGPDSTIRDTAPLAVLPTSISVLQIVATEAYKAHITIHDYRDRPIRTFDQEFGYNGELDNLQRVVPGGVVSFLVWDNKLVSGLHAPDGVYLWKVRITFASGVAEDRTQLAGLLGEACRAELAR